MVARREGKLRVYNRIYQEVFNQNWVENELKNLRPYSENFKFWVASGGKDQSRLLRGQALADAEEWAKDKNLSYQDKQFLAASREKEIQEKIAESEKEAQLERERKDREAAEQRNQVLAKANRKAKKRIRVGSIALVLTLMGAGISIFWAGKDIREIREDTKYISRLSKLSEELDKKGESSAASKAREEIGLAYEITNRELKKARLFTSMSQAFQKLEEWDDAEDKIEKGLNILENTAKNNNSNQALQIKVWAYKVQGDLLASKKEKNQAIKSYKSAWKILKDNPEEKTSPFTENNQLFTAENIESVHRGLLNLKPNRDRKVWDSLKEHYYAKLENSLKRKNWEEADQTTDRLMLFIADREEENFLNISDIEKFSCPDLEKMDELWVQSSNKYFGWSVQKEIWVDKGNRLGIRPQDWNRSDYQNYQKFASAVGWYNEKEGFVIASRDELISKVVNEKDTPQRRGGLPSFSALESGDESQLAGGNVIRVVSNRPTLSGLVRELLFSRAATCKL